MPNEERISESQPEPNHGIQALFGLPGSAIETVEGGIDNGVPPEDGRNEEEGLRLSRDESSQTAYKPAGHFSQRQSQTLINT